MDRGDDLRYRFKRSEYLQRRAPAARPHAASNSLGEFVSTAPAASPLPHAQQAQTGSIAVPQPLPQSAPLTLGARSAPAHQNIVQHAAKSALSQPDMPQFSSASSNPAVRVVVSAPAPPPQPVAQPVQIPSRPMPRPTSNEFVAVPSRLLQQPVHIPQEPTQQQAAYDYPPVTHRQAATAVSAPQTRIKLVDEQVGFEALQMDQDAVPVPATFAQHTQVALEPHKTPRKHRTKKRKLLLATPVAVLVLAGGGYFAYGHFQSPAKLPQTLAAEVVIETEEVPVDVAAFKKNQAQLKYPLYYLKTLPKGYTVDESTYAITSGLFNFKIRSPKGKLIPVVEQQLLPDFKLPGANKAVSVNIGPRDFTTEAGKANIVASNENVIGVLDTEKTVIILNLSGIPGADCEPIIRGFDNITNIH